MDQRPSNTEGMQETSSHDHALCHLTTDVGMKEVSKKQFSKST
jgi:hypothetical protein